MRHASKVSAFVIGVAVGAIAVESIMYQTCPPVKRMIMKKGMRAMRAARSVGERIF